jgi:hypothetical protein
MCRLVASSTGRSSNAAIERDETPEAAGVERGNKAG